MQTMPLGATTWVAMLILGLSPCWGLADQLVPRPVLAQQGLERAWFTQVELDRARDQIEGVTHSDDTLFVQTDSGVLQAIDAETGRTRWSISIGQGRHPSTAPAANDKYVAVIRGSRLYIADRATGGLIWDRQLVGGPGAGPAVTETRVFVPMINGRIEAYQLERSNAPPWIYASAGRALIQPISTKDSVSWPTDLGHLYVSGAENPGVRFRLETDFAINSQPGYRKPWLFAASLDGYVYAVHERSGNQVWQFSTGNPIDQTPIPIADRVYVCPRRGGLFCLAIETGQQLWWAPRVAKFLAAGKERIYGTDLQNTLYVLDAKTGGRLATIPLNGLNLWLSNHQTDRIYLGSRNGLIQCLHEVGLDEPMRYAVSDEDEKQGPPAANQPPEEQPAEPPPIPESVGQDAGNPFDDQEPADEPEDDPFGGDDGGEDPFGGAIEDDPFG